MRKSENRGPRSNNGSYLKRQKELFKIFEKLQNSKLIESFKKRPTVKGTDVHAFSLKPKNITDVIRIYFVKSSKLYELTLQERKSHELRIKIGDKVVPNKILSFVSGILKPLIFGFKNENVFLRCFNEAKKRLSKNSISLQTASTNDDKSGIDFWIIINKKKIPLQIKYVFTDTDKQESVYFTIPTILFKTDRFGKSFADYEELYEKVKRIGREYSELNRVLHL
ncbi:hypothetical protein IT400_01060 [Candidatus Nomurabacteria bacterium]|nr:hypothetical protein [Candidatus Nomurabacteria bacterium]